MPTHQITQGWTRNSESLTITVSVPVDTENNADLRLSGGASGSYVNDSWGTLINLATLDIRPSPSFPGSVQLKTHASGSFLSGGVVQTFHISSGYPLQWFQTSGVPLPLTSGQQVTALSIQRVAPTSGNVLITVRAGFTNVVLSG